MEGVLKQQCTNEEGQYFWQKKYFILDLESLKVDLFLLNDAERKDPTTSIALASIKNAKEWSFSSAVGGYGFDLTWVSGKIWSFLVDKESDCQRWVALINRGISLYNERTDPSAAASSQQARSQNISNEVLETIKAHKQFLQSLNSSGNSSSMMVSDESINQTHHDAYSPFTSKDFVPFHSSVIPNTIDRYSNSMSDVAEARRLSVHHPQESTQTQEMSKLLPPSTTKVSSFRGGKNRYDEHENSFSETAANEKLFPLHYSQHDPYSSSLQNISMIPRGGSNIDSNEENSSNHSDHSSSIQVMTTTTKMLDSSFATSHMKPPKPSSPTRSSVKKPVKATSPVRKQSSSTVASSSSPSKHLKPSPSASPGRNQSGHSTARSSSVSPSKGSPKPPKSKHHHNVSYQEDEEKPNDISYLPRPVHSSTSSSSSSSSAVPLSPPKLQPFRNSDISNTPPSYHSSTATSSHHQHADEETKGDGRGSYVSRSLPPFPPSSHHHQHHHHQQQQQQSAHHPLPNSDHYLQNMKSIFQETKNSLIDNEHDISEMKITNDAMNLTLRSVVFHSCLLFLPFHFAF
jgi:hypothetical protein